MDSSGSREDWEVGEVVKLIPDNATIVVLIR